MSDADFARDVMAVANAFFKVGLLTGIVIGYSTLPLVLSWLQRPAWWVFRCLVPHRLRMRSAFRFVRWAQRIKSRQLNH